MPKVKLNDVAVECKETIKGNAELPVVGLEHLVPGEICLTQWSDDSDNTFTKRFRKGQVLFGRRRAYLKKAVVAPFDGICSGDITVIAAKPDVLDPELLPFIIQNDALFDYAVEHSAGSLSPRVKWEHLKNYEFQLPDMEKQRELARLLWAAADVKRAYQKLIQRSEELVKSQFIAEFGDIVSNDRKWPMMMLGDFAFSRLGKMLDANKQTGKYTFPYIANYNVQWFHLELTDLRMMDFNPDDQEEFSLQDGDLLVCEGGEVGRCAIWHNEVSPCFFQKAIHRIRCDRNIVLPEYLAYWFKYHSDYNQFEDIVGAKTSITHLPGIKLKKLLIPIPPMSAQKHFIKTWCQLDKSKFAAKRALENLQATQKALIRKYLG